MTRPTPVIDRIARKCVYEDRGHTSLCCIYTGAVNGFGYGMIDKHSRVHRITYEHFVGPIPDGLELDHLCRAPACCNPDHLEAVTHAENIRRGRAAKVTRERYAAITHCPHGHEYTPENTYVKMYRGRPARSCRECGRQSCRRYWHAVRKHRLQEEKHA